MVECVESKVEHDFTFYKGCYNYEESYAYRGISDIEE